MGVRVPKLNRRHVVAFLFGFFLIFLLVDLIQEASESPVHVVFQEPKSPTQASPRFSVSATLEDLSLKPTTDELFGTFRIEIDTSTSEDQIESLTFSPTQESDGSRFFAPPIEKNEFLLEIDHQLTPDGPILGRAIVNHNIKLPITHRPKSLFYPFDTLSFSLSPLSCVNENEAGSCYTKTQENVETTQVPSLRLDLKEFYQTMDVETSVQANGNVVVYLRRDSFIRVISIYFFVVVAFILWHIIRTHEPQKMLAEALGLFAALWGLRQMLVPKDFPQFPTIVDYVIFILYTLLFAIVVTKLQFPKEISK